MSQPACEKQRTVTTSLVSPPWGILVLMLLVVEGMSLAVGSEYLLQGGLHDTDSYTRLNRVLHLYSTGDWYDRRFPRSNAPYGEVVHWTRPLDVILMGGAVLLTPLLPFATGLHWWGVVISPLLLGMALAGFIWMVKPFLDRERFLLYGGLFLLQPALFLYSFPGRPDHHSLILCCFVWVLAGSFRLLSQPFQPRVCLITGAVAGLAVWVSVESIVGVMTCFAAVGLFWIRYGQDFAKKMAVVVAAMCLVLTIALLVEYSWDKIFVAEYDRYSIVHWTALTLYSCFWGGMYFIQKHYEYDRKPAERLALALLGGVLMGGILWMVFPKFFQGPLVDVDPKMMALLWNQVTETQPIVSMVTFQFDRLIYFLGIGLMGIPYLLWLYWNEQDDVYRALWILIGIGLLVFLPLTLSAVRWAPYAEILLVPPYAHFVMQVFQKVEQGIGFPGKGLVAGVLVAVLCFGPIYLGVAMRTVENNVPPSSTIEVCPLSPLATYLRDPNGFGNRPRTILTFVDFGPELLYRTAHSVISTPSHRNIQGLLDSFKVMTAREDEEAHTILDTRRVDLLLLCPGSPEKNFYTSLTGKAPWYDKLRQGDHPSWIKEISLPSELQKSFQLFEVLR